MSAQFCLGAQSFAAASRRGPAPAARRAQVNAAQSRGRRAALSVSASGSVLADTPQAPPDPILGVSEAFKASTAPKKLNLGVGAYRDDNLKPMVLEVVKEAEKKILERELSGAENKEYLAMEGLPAFNKVTAELLFGKDNPVLKDGRVATLQSLSGTGSLRVGAAFCARFLKGRTVFISEPTWGNHKNIFGDEGVAWKTYRYFDPKTVGLDFAGLMEDLTAAPDGSIVVLHGCAHNPTGIDPTPAQWSQIADLCIKKGLVPFFDVAYQGFASGSLDKDAYSPRLFVEKGLELFVAQSYSKNLGLYSERIGALNVVVKDKETAGKVLSQLKRMARAMYSNPPSHGAKIVAEIVGNGAQHALFNKWQDELTGMSGRIDSVRKELKAALDKLNPDKDWSFITKQIGMFSFTGLSPKQVDNMTQKHNIFMTRDGRISLAGLNSANVDVLARAIDESFKIAP